MKAILLSMLFFFVAGDAIAEDIDCNKTCRSWSQMAEEIMTMRQNGYSMQVLMDEWAKNNEMAQDLVIRAYNQSRYHSDQMRRRKIEDFRDESYLGCITGCKEATAQ